MSIKVMNEVWESSNTAGTKRLMMVALADHANDEGYCYPSVIRLAVKCNCTERNAQILLRELEDTGELTVEVSAGRGNKSAYWVRPPATLDRLIVEYQEMLTRAKTNPEKVKFSALLEKVKFSAEKVKFSAEKVKNSAEKVKHISPKPYEPSDEPERTISDPLKCHPKVTKIKALHLTVDLLTQITKALLPPLRKILQTQVIPAQTPNPVRKIPGPGRRSKKP
jgi:hypothetical protein